ncbi:MAG: metallophosphatase family protein [Actinomycetota bacterium]|nr:metallophosphatase family protein [Actinomycetota bacterium]
MRVAALYDIHGNLWALEPVLREATHSDIDAIVIGGDIAWGPHPRETIDRLLELERPVIFIRGNADREVSKRLDENAGLDRVVAQINLWCSDQLSEQQRLWLGSQPPTATLDVDCLGETLFCHGSPRSDEEIITTATADERFVEVLRAAHEEIVVCGHTHIQFDRTVQDRRLINAGSVGLPYEGKPGAYWALLGPGVTFRRTAYDIAEAAEGMLNSGCPHVEEVFIDPLRHPPDRDDATRHFESMTAKSV